ncbi:TolC family protein [candidate division KSB1 bacterium]|nr:TolC family protein [candidate division KSB1 bacterium]
MQIRKPIRYEYIIFSICSIFIQTICFAADTEFSISKLLKMAVHSNYTTKAVNYQLEKAKANVILSKSKYRPRLCFTSFLGIANLGGGIPVSNSFLLPGKGFDQRMLTFGDIGITSKWLLYDSGKISQEIEEKQLLIDLTKLQNEQTINALMYEITLLYCQFIHAKNKYASIKKQVSILKKAAEVAKYRYNSGLLSRVEQNRLELQLFRLEDKYLYEQHIYEQYRNQLRQQSGIEELSCWTDASELDICLVDSLVIDVLKIQQASLMTKVNTLRLKQARQYNGFKLAAETYLRYSATSSWMMGIGLQWPLWDAGETNAMVTMAQSQQQLSDLEVEQMRKTITQNIEMCWEKMCFLKKRKDSFHYMIENMSPPVFENISAVPMKEEANIVQQQIEHLEIDIEMSARIFQYRKAKLEYMLLTNQLKRLLN